MSIFQRRTPRVVLANGVVLPEGTTLAHYIKARISAAREKAEKRQAVVEKILAKPRKK